MNVKKVLCDNGSNIDILFAAAFKGMKLKESKLTPVRTATYAVGPKQLPILGCSELPVMFVEIGPHNESHFTMMMVK